MSFLDMRACPWHAASPHPGPTTIDSQARTAINALIDALQLAGILAPD